MLLAFTVHAIISSSPPRFDGRATIRFSVLTNEVNNMTFDPDYLVSFHSKVMTLLPGDIISTGTPGAVVIRDGDVIECQVDGFTTLRNSVKDLKDKDNEKG